MIQNLIFTIIFLKILLWACNDFIYVYTFQWTSSEFFLIFRLFSRKSQSQQKLAKKVTHFTIQFRSKNLTHFTKLNSLDIENNMLPQHSQKLSWLSWKTFGLHHFLTPKNCILVELWKQMSVSFCISLQENFCSKDVVRFCLMKGGLGTGERLNNFLKAACCLGLMKCFTIFHFNWLFLKIKHFSAFWYFYL